MGRALALAGLLLLTESCALVFSLDGYQGPGSTDAEPAIIDGASPDRPPDAVQDATSPDATTEAASNDAALDAGDASATGDGPVGDADAGTWCANQTFDAATFCFDYDEPDASAVPSSSSGGASLNIQPDDDSRPNAMVVSVPDLASSAQSALAVETFSPPNVSPGSAEMAFDFKTSASTAVFLAQFYWYRGGNAPVIYTLASGVGALTLHVTEENPEAGNPGTHYDGSASVTDHLWHRYDLTIAASGSATLKLDGNTVIDAASPFGAVWEVDFQWGVTYAGGPSAASTYHFDNVVLQTR